MVKFKRQDLLGAAILLALGIALLYVNYGDRLPANWNFFRGLSQSTKTDSTEVKEYKFDKTVIRSDLSYEAAEKTYSFLKDVYKNDFLPDEVSLLLQKKGAEGKGDEYAGGWTKGEIFMNVLYVTSNNPKSPNYLRAWYLPTAARELTKAKAVELLGKIFNEKVLSLANNLSCKDAKAENGIPVTVCDIMTLTSQGKQGILVRTPLIVNAIPSTVVSACLYPQGSEIKDPLYCL